VTAKPCYCCTCPEIYGGSDPYCRNHGHAGVRRCVTHSSSDRGQGVCEGGKLLATVQEVRELRKSWSEADRHVRGEFRTVGCQRR